MADELRQSSLLEAIASGRAQEVKRLIHEEDVPVNGPAFEFPDPADIKPAKLDDAGLQLCIPDEITYISPLNWAVFNGRMPTVKYLVEKAGAHPEGASSDGRRPLHTAVSKGNAEIIQWLAEVQKIDLNCLNYARESALYHSLFFEHQSIFDYLVEKGASLEGQTAFGFTGLHMAASHGLTKAVEYLCEHCPALINKAALDGTTPLHLAALHGHLEVTECLLRHSADPSVVNGKAQSALTLAASKNTARHAAVAKVLVEQAAGSSLDERDLAALLDECCVSGNGDIIPGLVKQGADVNQPNPDGQCPLHTAAFNANTQAVRALLAAGADVNKPDDDGESALFYADLAGSDEVMDLLRAAGARET